MSLLQRTVGPAFFALMGGLALVSLAIVACSSDDDTAVTPVSNPTSEAGSSDSSPSTLNDAGLSDGSGLCEPQRVPGLTPSYFSKPGPAYSGACGATGVNDWMAACLRNASPGACEAFKAASPNCFNCMYGEVNREPAAAIVEFPEPSFIDRNTWACVAMLTGDTSEGSCARKVAASVECELKACRGCKLEKNEDFEPFNKCTSAARNSEQHCRPARLATDECAQKVPQIVRDVCFENISADGSVNGRVFDVFEHYGNLFCGLSPDAGDAGDAGDSGM